MSSLDGGVADTFDAVQTLFRWLRVQKSAIVHPQLVATSEMNTVELRVIGHFRSVSRDNVSLKSAA